jgi:hypothetical protein
MGRRAEGGGGGRPAAGPARCEAVPCCSACRAPAIASGPRCRRRYCKTDDHPDIPIPCWQLYQHKYSQTFLVNLRTRNELTPWQERKQVRQRDQFGATRQAPCPGATRREALCVAAASSPSACRMPCCQCGSQHCVP